MLQSTTKFYYFMRQRWIVCSAVICTEHA